MLIYQPEQNNLDNYLMKFWHFTILPLNIHSVGHLSCVFSILNGKFTSKLKFGNYLHK